MASMTTGPAGLPANAVASAVPLAPRTSLELGGPAHQLVTVRSEDELRSVVRWAGRERLDVTPLGGGTNVVVADRGVPGLVVLIASRGSEVREDGLVVAAAGEEWDRVVASAVAHGLAGIECLSGIPGNVGATPIQNVGAYGQEVGEVLAWVRAVDRLTAEPEVLTPAECQLGYRTSCFRRQPGRFVVCEVAFRLRPGGAPTLRYSELARAVAERGTGAGLAAVRRTVLELRRAKSMVLDDRDPNRRSVGSFFVNPVLDERALAQVVAAAAPAIVPRHPLGDGRAKVPAAWLIEAAGFSKGERRGAVGISDRHALALVHHGGGTTAELLALAAEIRAAVAAKLDVTLTPEPVFLGFPPGVDPLGSVDW